MVLTMILHVSFGIVKGCGNFLMPDYLARHNVGYNMLNIAPSLSSPQVLCHQVGQDALNEKLIQCISQLALSLGHLLSVACRQLDVMQPGCSAGGVSHTKETALECREICSILELINFRKSMDYHLHFAPSRVSTGTWLGGNRSFASTGRYSLGWLKMVISLSVAISVGSTPSS